MYSIQSIFGQYHGVNIFFKYQEFNVSQYFENLITQQTKSECFILGEAFYHLDAPVIRVTGVDTPMPYTKSLEMIALPVPSDIVDATTKVLGVS